MCFAGGINQGARALKEISVQIPPHLKRLMQEGFVIWIYNTRRDPKEPKQGEQFWLEGGELHAKSTRMFEKKDVYVAGEAVEMFKNMLGSLAKGEMTVRMGDSQISVLHEDDRRRTFEKTLDDVLFKMCRIPQLPKGISKYDIPDELRCKLEWSCHRRRQKKVDAYDAQKAKVDVFRWMLQRYGDAVIIPEFGIGGGAWSKTSIIDMAAFGPGYIAAVEIKAENDTYERLAKQLKISSSIADEVWLAVHESKSQEDLGDNIGVLVLRDGQPPEIIREAQHIPQDPSHIGHIWTVEWREAFGGIRGASKWIREECRGVDGMEERAAAALGERAREFTIGMWRSRYQLEFVWRRDRFLNENISEAAFEKRGKRSDSNKFWDHFDKNYEWVRDRIHSPLLTEFGHPDSIN